MLGVCRSLESTLTCLIHIPKNNQLGKNVLCPLYYRHIKIDIGFDGIRLFKIIAAVCYCDSLPQQGLPHHVTNGAAKCCWITRNIGLQIDDLILCYTRQDVKYRAACCVMCFVRQKYDLGIPKIAIRAMLLYLVE